MQVLNQKLIDTPVMSLQSGDSLGVTSEIIIDPRKLQIAAFYVSGPRIQATSILHTEDIREIGSLGMIVDSADNIMELDENLVRLNEIINFNFVLIGKPVIDDTKKKLGKVVEYSIDTLNFNIQKLYVSQSVIKNFSSSNLVINRSQVVEVTDHAVIVRSATVPKTEGLVQAINPFRKPAGNLAPEQSKLE